VNVPLYGNPLAGDNVPLYSSPNPGSNTPLFSNSSLANNYTLGSGFGSGGSAGSGAPITCRGGIPVGEWSIYPSVRLYSIYSNNLFSSPGIPLALWGLGATPTLTAQWTNGIHSTTIFANVDGQQYPANNPINVFDRKATFTQKYTPTPDLTFTVLTDYTHTTIAGALTNSIPNVISNPVTTPTLLPNGNIELPNGLIISPTGQIVGSVAPGTTSNGQIVVNPSDQYTTTATMTKVGNGAILTVSGSWAQTDYKFPQGGGPGTFSSFTTKTLSENYAVALGPVFYAYSNGDFATHLNGEGILPYSQAYRVIGGIGTRQIDLFRASVYAGYQGSISDASSKPAGGQLYGGTISYYPTLVWTITAALDETINKAPANAAASTQALTVNSPEQIPLSASTRITRPSLKSQYQVNPQWSISGDFAYTQIDYYGSPRLDHGWEFDTQVSYEIWRNMTLSWEYSWAEVLSNIPGSSFSRSYLMMSANYRF